MKLKKRLFDAIIIILMALLLTIGESYNLLCEYVHFSVIPLTVFYLLGQYSERNFK